MYKFDCNNCGRITFTMAETARQLAKPGLSVVVLETKRVAWGASGRVWVCPTCRDQVWPVEEDEDTAKLIELELNWKFVKAVPYEGDDPTMFGASFDRWKFYSPRLVARCAELGAREASAKMNEWLWDNAHLWPKGDMDGMQYVGIDGDYIVCRAISL